MGYDVLLPITESAEYDLAVDTPEGIFRVQCKYLGEGRKEVDLRRIHSNSQGYVVKLYGHQAYDWLYVYSPSRGEYLHRSFVTTKSKCLSDAWKLQPTVGDGLALET